MGIDHSTLPDMTRFGKKINQESRQDSISSGNISPLSGEMPYYSYFAGKPIGNDSKMLCGPVVPNSKLITYSKSINFPHIKDIKNESQMLSLPEKITIVSLGVKEKSIDNDEYIQRLSQISLNYPILKSFLNYSNDKKVSNEKIALTTKNLTNRVDDLCDSIQSHLNQIVSPVMQAQAQLNPKIINLNDSLSVLTTALTTKNKTLDGLCETFFNDSSIFDLSTFVKIRSDITHITQIMADLNSKLPAEFKLPDFDENS
ncbi:unnamed protein product [Gordionus sp. m RMFG-2023]|uniref:uncharacterized protein LOC135929988 n=1 Tax=Gordionus sp. m RMFG-2023 TaxID=3053472 RepID=UPI0030DE3B3A